MPSTVPPKIDLSKVESPSVFRSIMPYHSLRKVKEHPFTVYELRVPVQAVVGIPNDENVRQYMLDAEGRKRRRASQVHREIEDTLRNRPEMFDVLNSGITVCTPEVSINNQSNTIDIGCSASLINGAQTQGVIEDVVSSGAETDAYVRMEVIVCSDRDTIADISIARNSQNAVMPISIAGRKGIFDELEACMRKHDPEICLRKSETDLGERFLSTEHLLQVIAALVPESIGAKYGYNHPDAYGKKTKWIKLFAKLYDTKDEDPVAMKLYKFHLDVAYDALVLYNEWKTSSAFKGCGLWCIERENGEIADVPDGIVFPIISAYSNFAVYGGGKWKLVIPKSLKEQKLADMACRTYKEFAGHNVNVMGKKAACYSAISAITEIYQELA